MLVGLNPATLKYLDRLRPPFFLHRVNQPPFYFLAVLHRLEPFPYNWNDHLLNRHGK